jgi:hypothetical protein
MRRRRSIRGAALVLATVTVLTAVATVATAVPVEWHDGVHPRPMHGATIMHVRSGGQSAWSTIAAVTEAVSGVMRATAAGCAGEVTGGSLGRVVLGAVSCVARTAWMVTKGVPLPRAAAGAAVELLTRGAASDQTEVITGVDNERTHDAHSR